MVEGKFMAFDQSRQAKRSRRGFLAEGRERFRLDALFRIPQIANSDCASA